MMRITIQTFAVLRDHFESSFELECEEGATVKSVLEQLSRMRPEAKETLAVTRAALNEEFVSLSVTVEEGQTLFLLPPSSGG